MRDPPLLYVEDDENDVFFMRWAFEHAGVRARLHVVGNGNDAVDYIAGKGKFSDRTEHPWPCVVILDLNLPYKSGLEVLEWIRARREFKDLPVVVFTASDQASDMEKATQLSASDFVTKPSSPTRLVDFARKIYSQWLETCTADPSSQ